MILLVTPTSRAEECSQALSDVTHQTVQVAPSVQEAAQQLRVREFRVVILDELALEFEPDEADSLLALLGSAVPVYVNFAIHNKQRIVGEVQTALRRREVDENAARRLAQQLLRNQMKETVTAMLLSCDLLMVQPGLPTRAAEKVRTVQELAGTLRSQLGELT